jgi:hypothetical protein
LTSGQVKVNSTQVDEKSIVMQGLEVSIYINYNGMLITTPNILDFSVTRHASLIYFGYYDQPLKGTIFFVEVN